MKKAKKPSPKASPAKAPPKRKRAADTTILARMVEGPVPYLEVAVRERVTEASLGGVFEHVRGEVFRYQAKRLLVDVRGGSVALTISDMLGLAKMVTTTFAGVLERFALLLRPQDVLSEKFFEPSVNHRGLPTMVTTDSEEAAYWIAAKLRLGR
jgi:hypothetical protein